MSQAADGGAAAVLDQRGDVELELLLGAIPEEAGGRLALEKSPLGGLRVEAVMRLGHVDRKPLGDVAATVAPA